MSNTHNVRFSYADIDPVEKKLSKRPGIPRIYLFGDSLTERAFYQDMGGFGARLRAYYEGRKVGVLNRGKLDFMSVDGVEFQGKLAACSGRSIGQGRSTKPQYLQSLQDRFTSRWLRNYFEEKIIKEAENQGVPPLLVTIFLGANDACLPPSSAHVPLEEYSTHIRNYVDSILTSKATRDTKILLISPPPINILAPRESEEYDGLAAPEALVTDESLDRGYRTWSSKRQYAKRIVDIGTEYEQKTPLVGLLDFWTIMKDFGLEEAGKTGWVPLRRPDNVEVLPGCGLAGAPEFAMDVFVDGLHLGPKGYDVLSEKLLEYITHKWPEIRRQNLAQDEQD